MVVGAVHCLSVMHPSRIDHARRRDEEHTLAEVFDRDFMMAVRLLRRKFQRARTVCYTTFHCEEEDADKRKHNRTSRKEADDKGGHAPAAAESGYLVDFVFLDHCGEHYRARCVMTGKSVLKGTLDDLLNAVRDEMPTSVEGEVFIENLLNRGLRALGTQKAVRVHHLAITVHKIHQEAEWSCKVTGDSGFSVICRAQGGAFYIRKESKGQCMTFGSEGLFHSQLAQLVDPGLAMHHDLSTGDSRQLVIASLSAEFPHASHVRHLVVNGLQGIAVDFLFIFEDGDLWKASDLRGGFRIGQHTHHKSYDPPSEAVVPDASLPRFVEALRRVKPLVSATNGRRVVEETLNRRIQNASPGVVRVRVSELAFPSDEEWRCVMGCEIFRRLSCEYNATTDTYTLDKGTQVLESHFDGALVDAVNRSVMDYIEHTFGPATCTRFLKLREPLPQAAQAHRHHTGREWTYGYQIDFYFVFHSGDGYSAYFIFNESWRNTHNITSVLNYILERQHIETNGCGKIGRELESRTHYLARLSVDTLKFDEALEWRCRVLCDGRPIAAFGKQNRYFIAPIGDKTDGGDEEANGAVDLTFSGACERLTDLIKIHKASEPEHVVDPREKSKRGGWRIVAFCGKSNCCAWFKRMRCRLHTLCWSPT